MKMHLAYLIDTAWNLKPQHIMQRIQLELFHWFNSKKWGMDLQPLQLVVILQEVARVVFMMPLMPPQTFTKT